MGKILSRCFRILAAGILLFAFGCADSGGGGSSSSSASSGESVSLFVVKDSSSGTVYTIQLVPDGDTSGSATVISSGSSKSGTYSKSGSTYTISVSGTDSVSMSVSGSTATCTGGISGSGNAVSSSSATTISDGVWYFGVTLDGEKCYNRIEFNSSTNTFRYSGHVRTKHSGGTVVYEDVGGTGTYEADAIAVGGTITVHGVGEDEDDDITYTIVQSGGRLWCVRSGGFDSGFLGIDISDPSNATLPAVDTNQSSSGASDDDLVTNPYHFNKWRDAIGDVILLRLE